jgi:hypothetical protein
MTHITKTPTQLSKHPHIHTHYKTHTYTHPRITKQVKTIKVQDTHQIKQPQYTQVPSKLNGEVRITHDFFLVHSLLPVNTIIIIIN